jgi:hypothetical protein
MKFGRLLYALWACGPLAVGVGAAESPAHNGSPAAVADTNQASAGSASDRNASVKTGRSAARESTHVGPGYADGVLSLRRNAQARGRLAGQPNGRVGQTRAAAHGPHDVRGQGVIPAGQPKQATSNRAPPPAARLTSTARNLAIGGPHAQGIGRVGGPAISRTTHGATGAAIDGTQLRHKF